MKEHMESEKSLQNERQETKRNREEALKTTHGRQGLRGQKNKP